MSFTCFDMSFTCFSKIANCLSRFSEIDILFKKCAFPDLLKSI